MEPSSRVLFTHTDGDGDDVRIVTTLRDRLTVGVSEGPTSSYAYLTRDAAAVLRDALTGWLAVDDQAPDPGGWKSAVDALSADAITAEHRTEALRLAVSLAFTGEHRHRVFQVAGEFARYLATGDVPPEETPAAVPPLLTFVDAAPAPGCVECGHPYHGVAVCADGAPGTAYVDRCQCRGRR